MGTKYDEEARGEMCEVESSCTCAVENLVLDTFGPTLGPLVFLLGSSLVGLRIHASLVFSVT